jgi:hypothetical protein
MVNINSAYPTKYLAANDLGDQPRLGTIKTITFEEMNDGQSKLCVWLNEYDKGLILNKTNANNIAGFLGPETDAWMGHQIVMVSTMVDFQGRSVEAIRVRAPKNRPAPAPRTVAQPQSGPPPGHPADLSDEVPF